MTPPKRAYDHPIELVAPDLSAYRHGSTGVDYVHRFDSGRPGPQVMVQALTHGNEICGAIALDWLMLQDVRPQRGMLTLAFANVEAFSRWDPHEPDASRFVDEDYNRIWADETLRGPRDSVELRRARELVSFVDEADYLLDIHSMHEPCRPIMVCGAADRGGEKAAVLAQELGVPEYLLIDTGHPSGLRMIERGAFGDPAHPRTAVLIECGQHWEKSAADVAIDTMLRFLWRTGVLTQDWVESRLPLAPPPEQRLVRVTEPVVAQSLQFRFVRDFKGLEVIPKRGDPIAYDGDRAIVAPYDETVLVMPSMAHLRVGTTMVRFGRFEPLAPKGAAQ
ncbi:MAG TPA: succinylglutamate desuccinylase/aspartoacylase family protein [Burkholderiaceae bacterium]|nr:succinylglutamate desuccinylase/aspartoacylase family protein [Burkholderiaceae bacterium]